MKREVIRDRAYLDWLRTQRCIVTGVHGTECNAVDPAHVGTLGKGIKSPDNEALPLLHSLHVWAHQHGEMTMFRDSAPDDVLRAALRALAREMYAEWKAENPSNEQPPIAGKRAKAKAKGPKKKIANRGFDKTKTRTMAGKVKDRAGHAVMR